MNQGLLDSETLVKRAAVGAAIVGAHIGLVALMAATGFVAPTLVQSIAVTFMPDEPPRRPNRPDFVEPVLRPVQQVLIPPPEVVVPLEPANAIMAATETAPELPPTAPAPAASPAGSATIPEMSEVAYVVQPSPHYPPESRRIREQGLVILRVLVDESGHAKQIEIYRSSGHPRLDEAARAAVARAVFKPLMSGGTARPAAAIVPIEFSLRTSPS